MYSARINLILYYAGFGYVLFLVWGVIAFSPRWHRAGATALAVVGVAHPAAALAAWDLRRHADDGTDGPARPTLAGLAPVLASFAVAVVAILLLA